MLIQERRFKDGFLKKASFHETDYFSIGENNNGDENSYIVSYRSKEDGNIIKLKCFNLPSDKIVSRFEGVDECNGDSVVLEVHDMII